MEKFPLCLIPFNPPQNEKLFSSTFNMLNSYLFQSNLFTYQMIPKSIVLLLLARLHHILCTVLIDCLYLLKGDIIYTQ